MTKKREATTIVANAGVAADGAYGSVAPPLWASDTYRWPNADDKPDYDYSRTVNPNRDMLATALSELEGAAGGVVTNSGQSACLLPLLLAAPGALIVAPHDCYGGTYRLIRGFADQGKIRALFVDQTDLGAVERALEQGPQQVWIETPSNPLLRVTDIEAVASRAKAAGALVIADNTLPTPVRQKPLALGCDLVMHSTTKAINGHSDLFGGALLAADPAMIETLQWWTNAAGLAASAHDAWQTLRGLRTLPLRVDQQEKSARRLADWLAQHGQVAEVHYPGLASHPQRALAERQQSGPGFMISFRLLGDDGATAKFLAALELVTLASSLGGFSTLICKPSSMTHRGMPPEAQKEAGIDPNLLRLSVGLEEAGDLIEDFEAAFQAAE
ncbi:MAG: O-succinylhomoserine (thiol)-lyase [Alphaproteobacteria bacterium]|nr:O-succinylhomoserine (thiol)-lyase [Alphaproteobacteria bacterium]